MRVLGFARKKEGGEEEIAIRHYDEPEQVEMPRMKLGVIPPPVDIELELSRFPDVEQRMSAFTEENKTEENGTEGNNIQESKAEGSKRRGFMVLTSSRRAQLAKSFKLKRKIKVDDGECSTRSVSTYGSRVSARSLRRYLGFPFKDNTSTARPPDLVGVAFEPRLQDSPNFVSETYTEASAEAPTVGSVTASKSTFTDAKVADNVVKTAAASERVIAGVKATNDTESIASSYLQKLEARSPVFFFDEVDYVDRLELEHNNEQRDGPDTSKTLEDQKEQTDEDDDWGDQSTDESSTGSGITLEINNVHESIFNFTEALVPKLTNISWLQKAQAARSDIKKNTWLDSSRRHSSPSSRKEPSSRIGVLIDNEEEASLDDSSTFSENDEYLSPSGSQTENEDSDEESPWMGYLKNYSKAGSEMIQTQILKYPQTARTKTIDINVHSMENDSWKKGKVISDRLGNPTETHIRNW
eukprot:CAMPEP_0198141340 /NCGR_PEP_ID=MMETSP1443-20131203/4368_1 /TAXON_ID=186043 /ORGANISM="Entomoneis sp., Strain CCMP2396" /LENGTH=468 /DNA_ID=CAMNT_0043804067 /DNA_START=80 /DNA_END=1483 /DNA_ORIENTATION=+